MLLFWPELLINTGIVGASRTLIKDMDTAANKRIVKNTIYLYVRMLILMLVSLYTSRIILKILGVEDFGIYNVVGGVVVLFSFLNNALAGATQRFLNYEIGIGEGNKLKLVFSSSIFAHVLIIAGIILLSETIGLWFVSTQLNIPEERQSVVFWVYQLSIIVFCLNIIKAPYNAVLIAHEKMDFYAYFSIMEVLLKLGVVYLLLYIPYDKLITYSTLLVGVNLLVTLSYMYYSVRKFPYSKLSLNFDKSLVRQIFNFSMWSCYGNLSNVVSTHGLNFVLNAFFGVIANASMGIATQVTAAIGGFVGNFQTAVNPQLIKLYAAKNIKEMTSLIFYSSKMSFFLYFIMLSPVLLNMDYILHLWLGEVPQYASFFCQLMILDQLLFTMSGPLWVSAQASGIIKVYMLVVGTLNMISLPLAYVFMLMGYDAGMVLCAKIIMDIITYGYRIYYLKKNISMSIYEYMRLVAKPTMSVIIVCSPIFYVFSNFQINSISMLVVSVVVFVSLLVIASYYIGLTRKERIFCTQTIKNKLYGRRK